MNAEIIGIVGTLFVLASFCMNNIKKVRYINAIGAIIFVIYGLMIKAYSTWILNSILFFIQIYKLNESEKTT